MKKLALESIIRTEIPDDYDAIEQVTIAAFEGKPYSDQTEHLIIKRLREANALSLSLVAEMDSKIVGHVAFSYVLINGEDKAWYGLGPISVQPDFQRQGIGSKLVYQGLSRIRERGAKGCVLEGSPVYYQRFGFKSHPGLIYEGAPAHEFFMALPFYDEVPKGKVKFHDAFYTSTPLKVDCTLSTRQKKKALAVNWTDTWFHKVSVLFSIVSFHSYKSKCIRQSAAPFL